MDQLPTNYHDCLISHCELILHPFKYDDLLQAAKKGHGKAQRAILVILDQGLNEFKQK